VTIQKYSSIIHDHFQCISITMATCHKSQVLTLYSMNPWTSWSLFSLRETFKSYCWYLWVGGCEGGGGVKLYTKKWGEGVVFDPVWTHPPHEWVNKGCIMHSEKNTKEIAQYVTQTFRAMVGTGNGFLFRWHWVQISAQKSGIVTDVSRNFPQPLKANVEIRPGLDPLYVSQFWHLWYKQYFNRTRIGIINCFSCLAYFL
jgi:hypothetical protein